MFVNWILGIGAVIIRLFGPGAFGHLSLGVRVTAVQAMVLLALGMFGLASPGLARDLDGRHAASPLKPWFDQLRSKGGAPCCSDADGSAVSDADWESRDGRYRVRLEGRWWDVPEDAVITEPNRVGRTMVWPIYYHDMGKVDRIDIRCFIPGSMT